MGQSVSRCFGAEQECNKGLQGATLHTNQLITVDEEGADDILDKLHLRFSTRDTRGSGGQQGTPAALKLGGRASDRPSKSPPYTKQALEVRQKGPVKLGHDWRQQDSWHGQQHCHKHGL